MEALRDCVAERDFLYQLSSMRDWAHPDEWRWTRNLLVGSPFGLTLREEYVQDCNTPVTGETRGRFRMFRLFARAIKQPFTLRRYWLLVNPARADFLKDRDVLHPVRLYEIGRKGAFDLTARSTNRKTLQPENFDMERWWNPCAKNPDSSDWLLRHCRNRLVYFRDSGPIQLRTRR